MRAFLLLFVLIFAGCLSDQGTARVYFENSPTGVREVRVRGYKEAQKPVLVTINKDDVTIDTGIPPAPPSASEESIAWGIKAMFVLAGILLIGGIILIKFRNPRMGINLLIAAIILPIFAVFLMQMAAIPTWIWVLVVTIPSIIVAGVLYMKFGYEVGRAQVDGSASNK